MLTDEELAMAYIGGDNKAFDLLLSRTQGRLFSYIMFVVRDRDKAEDIFQETFVKVITRLHQRRYIPSGKFSSWLMRIAHNVIMDGYRSARLQSIVEPTADNDLSNLSTSHTWEGSYENHCVNDEVLNDLRRMVSLLPPTQREMVYMRFYQHIPFKEIAEMTGVSINTALGRMRYALINLRRMAKANNITLQLD